MRKLLGTVLAAALLLPPGLANAEVLKNLTLGGNLDVHTLTSRNVLDFETPGANDRLGTAVTRLMLDAKWDLLDDVHATVTFRKNDRTWGTTGTGGDTGALGAQALNNTATAGEVFGNVYLDRANVKIDKIFGVMDMTIGKQYFGEPGDLIFYIGPSDAYGLQNRGLDMLRADITSDMADFTAVAAKQTTNNAMNVASGQTDVDVHGAELWFKATPLKVNTFVWRQVTHNGITGGHSNANDYLWVYGLKLRGEASGGWFHADLAFNTGENRNAAKTTQAKYTGKAFLVKAGFNGDLPNVGGITPWANFGWGSGDANTDPAPADKDPQNQAFTPITSDYRPGIINRKFDGTDSLINLGNNIGNTAGGVGTNGLTNRVVWGVGLNFTPAAADKLTVGAQFWDFRFQRVDEYNNVPMEYVINAANGRGGYDWTQSAGNKHIGSEFGFTAKWQHSENVLISAGWANFQPGGYIRNRVGYAANWLKVSPVQMAYADFGVKF